MKVDQLQGLPLAMWVARATKAKEVPRPVEFITSDDAEWCKVMGFRPDLNWSQGGPVVDQLLASGHWQIEPWEGREWPRASIVCVRNYNSMADSGVELLGDHRMPRAEFPAPTALVAACRALVFSVYGSEVPDA